MAQYKIPDPEELIPCPYDKVHMIRAKRMQYHLMKCRKNYVGKDFATCPFNARHEMPRPELRYHMANCPDKALIEPALSYERTKMTGDGAMFKGCTDVPAYDRNFNVPQSENWDEEVPSVARIGVDPNFFLRQTYKDMTGFTRQEKKLYRQQMVLPPEERQFVLDSQEKEEEENEERKLRLPHQAPQAYMGGYRPQQKLQQPSDVFAYSLSMAGVGRGQSIANMANGTALQTNGAPPKFPGRGRGLGRGMLPPSMMMTAGMDGTASNSIPSVAASGPITNGMMMPQAAGAAFNPLMMQQATSAAAAPAVFTMGVGRGRGMRLGLDADKAEPSFVVPNVNKAVPENDEQGTDSDEQGSGQENKKNDSTVAASDMSANTAQTVEDEMELRNKTIKKIMKKLKQIDILEKKRNEGAALGTTEEMKISKKAELTLQLNALQA